MGFLDKAKAAAEQAATKAKEGVQDVQVKRDLSQAYTELGQTTFELAQSGELSHPRLTALIDKITTLKSQAEEGEPVATAAASSTEPPPSDQPPAMPT